MWLRGVSFTGQKLGNNGRNCNKTLYRECWKRLILGKHSGGTDIQAQRRDKAEDLRALRPQGPKADSRGSWR